MIKLTKQEREALHLKSGVRQDLFYASVLDVNGIDRGITLSILDGQLDMNSEYEVKKSGRIEFEDISKVETMRDKIQVFMQVNGEYTWSLGIYMITGQDGNTLILADETVKLQQATTKGKKVFKKGSLYTDALKWFVVEGISSIKINIQPSTEVLRSDIIVDDSKSLLAWFNEIADQINYRHLYVDNDGYFKTEKYREPSNENVGYSYMTDEYSVISEYGESSIDYYNVPNEFTITVSRGDLDPLTSTYTNNDPTNKFSVPYRGFTISYNDTVSNIATQQELDLYVSRLALKYQQVEETKKIITANMPIHGIYDIIEVKDGLYEEESHSMDLSYSGKMTHHLRRVVNGFEGIR